MDFVVVGFGLGALALLLGVIMHGWLARRWERTAARASTPDDRAADLAMAGWRRDSGQAFVTAGSALLIATVGALAGGLDDRIGAFLVTTTATVAGLGLLLWGYLYRLRHPAPPRRRAHPSAPSQPSASMAPARATLPALGVGAVAAERMNGVSNGATDRPLDDAEVRVVALDAPPAGSGDGPTAEADDASTATIAPDANEEAFAFAADASEQAPAVALVPASAHAPVPAASASDEDDAE